MPLLFASTRGRVVQLEDPGAAAQTQLYGWGPMGPSITYGTEFSIVTRLTMSQQVNVQFLHTIGSHIFVYVFGDRVGSINLSGLAFTGACDTTINGAEEMYSWYKHHRVSKRQAPVQITIGRTAIEGFVTGFSEDVVDPSTNLVQWGVSMVTLPEDT